MGGHLVPQSIDAGAVLLRQWRKSDQPAFAALSSDAEVMADLGGPLTNEESDAKLERFAGAFGKFGFGRWVIADRQGGFLGYAGVMPAKAGHPLGDHFEIGWRLARSAWGRGHATAAAQAALSDAFHRAGLVEVLAYTAAGNIRSQAVMSRVGMVRDQSRDFTVHAARVGEWHGLTWAARS